ncbi:MAG TPA: hypothetical protein VMT15_08950 [Bryobacteraceae bacterium]|nr:hypothetical protein [Bryobacteraceae bacterium]
MGRDEFLKSIDEILELSPGTVQGSEELDEFPLWDSTAIISFMALADTNNGTHLSPRELGACKTIADLLRLAKVEA